MQYIAYYFQTKALAKMDVGLASQRGQGRAKFQQISA